MALTSRRGYHTFHCPVCDRLNKVHEKRAINYVPLEKREPLDRPAMKYTWDDTLHFICAECHREIHVSRCPAGGIILAS